MKDTFHSVRIDRVGLLAFYDTIPESSKGHTTAINSVAGEDLAAGLLKHYFEKEEETFISVRDEPCTQKTQKGNRLDCWLHVKNSNCELLYQVEIKNWSAHAIGGKKLALDATDEEVSAYKIKAWARHWDEEKQELRDIKTSKVLQSMKPPIECDVRPLLCMWEAMHPKGKSEPFFTQELPANRCAFTHLKVFSMSSYLRTLNEPYLEIEMPKTVQRMDWLNKLFRVSC